MDESPPKKSFLMKRLSLVSNQTKSPPPGLPKAKKNAQLIAYDTSPRRSLIDKVHIENLIRKSLGSDKSIDSSYDSQENYRQGPDVGRLYSPSPPKTIKANLSNIDRKLIIKEWANLASKKPVTESGSHGKIFLEQAFADFSNRKFGLSFAKVRSLSKIGQILPENSSNFFGLAIPGNSKQNFLLVKPPRRHS